MKYLMTFHEHEGYEQNGDLRTWNKVKDGPKNPNKAKNKKAQLVDDDELEQNLYSQFTAKDTIDPKSMQPTEVKISL